MLGRRLPCSVTEDYLLPRITGLNHPFAYACRDILRSMRGKERQHPCVPPDESAASDFPHAL